MDEIRKFLLVVGFILLVDRHGTAGSNNWRPVREAKNEIPPSVPDTSSVGAPPVENAKNSEKESTISQSTVDEVKVTEEAFQKTTTENTTNSSPNITKEPIVIWINAGWVSNQKNETTGEGSGLDAFTSLTNMSLIPEGQVISEIPIEVQNETSGSGASVPNNDTIVISLIPGWVSNVQNVTSDEEKHSDGELSSLHGDAVKEIPEREKNIPTSKIAAEQDQNDKDTLNSQMDSLTSVMEALFPLLPKPKAVRSVSEGLRSDSFKPVDHEVRVSASEINTNTNFASENDASVSSEEDVIAMQGEYENDQSMQNDEDSDTEMCRGRASPPIEMMIAAGIIPGF